MKQQNASGFEDLPAASMVSKTRHLPLTAYSHLDFPEQQWQKHNTTNKYRYSFNMSLQEPLPSGVFAFSSLLGWTEHCASAPKHVSFQSFLLQHKCCTNSGLSGRWHLFSSQLPCLLLRTWHAFLALVCECPLLVDRPGILLPMPSWEILPLLHPQHALQIKQAVVLLRA